jgi:hypothetical protein
MLWHTNDVTGTPDDRKGKEVEGSALSFRKRSLISEYPNLTDEPMLSLFSLAGKASHVLCFTCCHRADAVPHGVFQIPDLLQT